uniref:Acetyltransferase n=1 Tax=Bradyrhizobium barranii subsp. barranii TaxID=2823807 RepID=A0A7Z0QL20_9BRAD|nr:hypothetical protein [Bradyrhizobium barranii]
MIDRDHDLSIVRQAKVLKLARSTVYYEPRPDSHVGPRATIGQSCILNTGCIVEHDCVVGDFSHVSVNATLAGRSRLGSFVFLGAGATIIGRCSVPDGTVCGAGAVVTRSLAVSGTYVGVPARLAKPSYQ